MRLSMLPRALLACAVFLLASCGGGGGAAPQTWTELPQVQAGVVPVSHPKPLLLQGNRVILGTIDGIYQTTIGGTPRWTRIGAEGLRVRSVIDLGGGTLLASGEPNFTSVSSIFRSEDAGATWTAVATVPRSAEGDAYPVYHFAPVPGSDIVFASLEGASLAVSTDRGRSFAFVNGWSEPAFGYPCVVHVMPEKPRRLYQGCELPLDDAWVGYYEFDPASPKALGPLVKVIESGAPDSLLSLSNRKPSHLTSRNGVLHAGVEGGMVELRENAAPRWWYRARDSSTEVLPYTYMHAVWLNPNDPMHALFGGLVPEDNARWSLYQSRDGGQTAQRVPPPAQLYRPAIWQIVPGRDPGEVLVLVATPLQGELSPVQPRVYLYRFGT